MRSCINSFAHLDDRIVLLRHDFVEALRVHVDITLLLEQPGDTRRSHRSSFLNPAYLILHPVIVPQLLLDEAMTAPLEVPTATSSSTFTLNAKAPPIIHIAVSNYSINL